MAFFQDAKGNVKGKKGQYEQLVAQSALIQNLVGNITLTTYTVASLPPFAENVGKLVICSDGDAGAKCLALATETAWLRISLGAAVAIA